MPAVEKGLIFYTEPYGEAKNKILKSGFLHAREDHKIGPEPKFHDPGTFGGFGKRGQTDTHTYKIHVL